MTAGEFGLDPEELAPGVYEKIVKYRCELFDDPDDLAVLGEVLPDVRWWAAAADPLHAIDAGTLLRAGAGFALFARQELRMESTADALTPDFAARWITMENGERTRSWQTGAWWALSKMGRVVNPDAWPLARIDAGLPQASPRYSEKQEAAYRREARLPGRRNRAGPPIAVAVALGAGGKGPEIVAAVPDDFDDLDDGRIAVRIRGRNPRRVPLRAQYSESVLLGVEAHLAAGRRADEPFIKDSSALMRTAEGLGAHGGPGLSLPRARSTWICAHLEGGTPLAALRALAGPLCTRRLSQLLSHTAADLDEETALMQGLGA